MAAVGTRQDHRDSFAAMARVCFVANRSLRLAGVVTPNSGRVGASSPSAKAAPAERRRDSSLSLW
jgi:hypothetical protein